MGRNPSKFKICGGDCPVESVSWNDVQEYIIKLNKKTAKNYRLPTEAEWEYAAKNRGKRIKWAGFSNERDLSQYANFCDESCELAWKTKNQNDGYKNTAPVKSYKPNSLGLYDMAGNVWEWVSDRYGDYYSKSPRLNPEGPASGNYRVIRGGSWGTEPIDLRTAKRSRYFPIIRNPYIGFRLALDKQLN
jgi:formylglycine-generating enzyme required for sulfatase activity